MRRARAAFAERLPNRGSTKFVDRETQQLRKIYGFRGSTPRPPPPHGLSASPHTDSTDTTADVTAQAIATAQDAAAEAEDARRKANTVYKLVRVNARGSAVGKPRQSTPAATLRGRV